MCIFCGGQCGGLGEFLISLGLPLLALYLYRMKHALLKITHKIFPRTSNPLKAQAKATACNCGAEWRSTGPNTLGLLGWATPLHEPQAPAAEITKLSNRLKIASKEGPRGVKGWLLILCLIFTLFIPASCLYTINCTLDLFNYPQSKFFLLTFNDLLFYNSLLIGTMVFLAIFSFYAGLRLWKVNQKAVKTAKIFLVIQLVLTVILVITRPFLTFPLGGSENNFAEIMQRLIPSLGNFSLWYLYLGHSRRVFNTYCGAEKNRMSLRQLPVKLKGYTKLS